MTNANFAMGTLMVLVILLAFYGQALANDKNERLTAMNDNINSQLETCLLK